MKHCKHIRRLIDEADRPDVLPYEAASHIASCGDCHMFADERVKLRQLLLSPARVGVPANFDAVLREKLSAAQSRRAFSWFSAAMCMRFGAATAGIIIAVFVVQYSGLLNDGVHKDQTSQPAITGGVASSFTPANQQPQPANRPRSEYVPPTVAHIATLPARVIASRQAERRARIAPRGGVAVDNNDLAVAGAVLLMRGQNAEREVPIPAVSVGAQPLLYVASGRQPTREVGASF